MYLLATASLTASNTEYGLLFPPSRAGLKEKLTYFYIVLGFLQSREENLENQNPYQRCDKYQAVVPTAKIRLPVRYHLCEVIQRIPLRITTSCKFNPTFV
jgi:hypothetical protein